MRAKLRQRVKRSVWSGDANPDSVARERLRYERLIARREKLKQRERERANS